MSLHAFRRKGLGSEVAEEGWALQAVNSQGIGSLELFKLASSLFSIEFSNTTTTLRQKIYETFERALVHSIIPWELVPEIRGQQGQKSRVSESLLWITQFQLMAN